MKNMIPKRLLSSFYVIFGSLLLSSCVATSGIERTSTIVAPGTSMHKYQTFAWYQAEPAAPAAYDKRYGPTLHQHLVSAVEEELKQKGYQKTNVNPDLLLAYDVSVSVPVEKDKPELFGAGFGYSYAYMAGYRYSYGNAQMPGYRAVDLFKEGTLILDVIDPNTNQLLWRGWTEGGISNFNAGSGKVRGLIRDIVKQFPAAGSR